VSIPFYRCGPLLRRSVESILAQSHERLTVLVLNDGDPNAPWHVLDGLADDRLIRFDLEKNRGPYFAHDVALEAGSEPYFLVQDADDWSAPDRIAMLLDRMRTDGSRWATSGCALHEAVSSRSTVLHSFRFCGEVDSVSGGPYWHRVGHNALFERDALRELGGYYGGVRIGYDTLIVNLCLMLYPHSHVPTPLYHVVKWDHSLTRDPRTGHGSPARQAVRLRLELMYEAALALNREFLRGRITAERLYAGIRALCRAEVSAADATALRRESRRLRAVLGGRLPGQHRVAHAR